MARVRFLTRRAQNRSRCLDLGRRCNGLFTSREGGGAGAAGATAETGVGGRRLRRRCAGGRALLATDV